MVNLKKKSIFLKLLGLIRCIFIKIYYIYSLESEGFFYVGRRIKFFIDHGKVKLGKRVRLSDFVHLQSSGKLEIGDYTTLNSFSRIIAFDQITIGSNCAIAAFVTILDHDHDFYFKDGQINYNGYIKKPVKIGSSVWIGDKVTILKGVTIGDNVIIGSNSLVNKDLPSNCIAGGVPCKVIRHLSEEEKK